MKASVMRRANIAGWVVAAALLVGAAGQCPAARLMTDEEMDEVCARGSRGFEVDVAGIREMAFEFSRRGPFGEITGHGVLQVETALNGTAQVNVDVTGTGHFIEVHAADATVRLTGDIDIQFSALPRTIHAVQRNQLLISAAARGALPRVLRVGR
jgi:hypothetical protein